jgi:RNA polymerase sigma factor (sigma-70 family)
MGESDRLEMQCTRCTTQGDCADVGHEPSAAQRCLWDFSRPAGVNCPLLPLIGHLAAASIPALDSAYWEDIKGEFALWWVQNPTAPADTLIGEFLRICDTVAKRTRRRARFHVADGETVLAATPSHAPQPGEQLDASRLFARLHEAVAALPPKKRRAVIACFFEGLTQAEAGHREGVSQPAIRKRILEALAGLRAAMGARQPPRRGARKLKK